MTLFFFCVALLLAGYFIYGALMVKVFGIKPQRTTPAHTHADGVDYVPMSRTKIWLIQLLNIAGTGPIFGPILGALYGPVAMLWIVVGCVFAGAVHDYFCGMISVRNADEAYYQRYRVNSACSGRRCLCNQPRRIIDQHYRANFGTLWRCSDERQSAAR